jgi:hypothetical protein
MSSGSAGATLRVFPSAPSKATVRPARKASSRSVEPTPNWCRWQPSSIWPRRLRAHGQTDAHELQPLEAREDRRRPRPGQQAHADALGLGALGLAHPRCRLGEQMRKIDAHGRRVWLGHVEIEQARAGKGRKPCAQLRLLAQIHLQAADRQATCAIVERHGLARPPALRCRQGRLEPAHEQRMQADLQGAAI